MPTVSPDPPQRHTVCMSAMQSSMQSPPGSADAASWQPEEFSLVTLTEEKNEKEGRHGDRRGQSRTESMVGDSRDLEDLREDCVEEQ